MKTVQKQTVNANRIEAAITRTAKRLAQRLATGELTQDKLAKCSEGCNVNPIEHAAYQDCKSRAQATGRMNLEEAMTLYRLLGETPEHFNAQRVAAKIVVTQVIGELLAVQS